MTIILETERLSLRELNLSDTNFIISLLNSPGWLRFIGDRNVRTSEEAHNYLQNGPMRSYQINGFGLWLAELKSTETAIGMCGLIKREGLDDIDIGFAILPEYAGQGYGYEVASATLTYGQNKLNIKRIVGITNPDNEFSIKLLQKIGLTFEKRIKLSPESEELLLFGISK